MVAPKTTVLAVYEYLYRETGSDKFRPPEIVKEMVKKGELGLVSGKGYYYFTREGADTVARQMDDMLAKMLKFLVELGEATPP